MVADRAEDVRPQDDRLRCLKCGAEVTPQDSSCFSCGQQRFTLKRGDVIDRRYELKGLLGRGGMGVVYEALDRRHAESVALKFVSERAQGDPEAERQFINEIRALRRIRHRNVCAIHGDGELDRTQYIVMEFVEGPTLSDYLRSKGRLGAGEAVRIAGQIGAGLQAIHDAGVIHRDLKPANVMLDAEGQVRLMDFGLAKRVADSTLTQGARGTPYYMSPEQAAAEPVDTRTDVYSLGVVTYQLLAGRVPFEAADQRALLHKILNEEPLFDGIEPAFVPVLRRALSKNAKDRYDRPKAFVDAITEVVSNRRGEQALLEVGGEPSDPVPSGSLFEGETKPASAPADETTASPPGAQEDTLRQLHSPVLPPAFRHSASSPPLLSQQRDAPLQNDGSNPDSSRSQSPLEEPAQPQLLENSRPAFSTRHVEVSLEPPEPVSAMVFGLVGVGLALVLATFAYLVPLAARESARADSGTPNRAVAPPPQSKDVPDVVLEEAESDTAPVLVSHEILKPTIQLARPVSVTLSFVVTTAGRVIEPKVINSGGAEVDAAVIASIRLSVYEPARKGGKAVSVRVLRRYTFDPSTSP
jgi:serine/threonine protein kinase